MKKVFLATLVFAGATTFAQAQEKKEMKTTSQNKETATETNCRSTRSSKSRASSSKNSGGFKATARATKGDSPCACT
ncbi:hypothetical protein QW060_17230 [Myroides ceti]|uniref:Uncharacterized protein n=1 Tax=Paenimyroides ceti TaxID=395087 RepID=A0ABT8CWC6_9FLAO|nr:hypothetical protein [Paenimyroides ceti]MDN3708844.1 hypothetical protein [Paenimyroides ceti]